MFFHSKTPLIAPALLIGLLLQVPNVFAGPKTADMGRYELISAEIATLSPSELSLIELQRERQDLLRVRAKENPRIFKNKLTILNNKITYLEDEIRRAKPYVVKQRLVPRTDLPAPKPVAEQAAVKPAAARPQPVQVSPQAAAPHAAVQKNAELVWTPNVTQPKTSLKPAERSELSQAPLAPKPVPAPAQVKVEPVAKIEPAIKVEPVQVQTKEISATALRADLQKGPSIPRKVDLRTSLAPASREAASTQALPPAPVVQAPPAPPAKQAAPAASKVKTGGKTGADWQKMARADKEIYILSVMGNLSRRDVYLMKPYNFYIDAIDQAIEKNPLLKQELVHRILMMTAYDSEPDSRKDLEKIWK